MKRKIVKIDEGLCNGCGLCVPACAEGAIEIIDGKAKLVSDIYCDGLGACLGGCPQDAIQIIEREAEAFDEAAVEERLEALGTQIEETAAPAPSIGGCPGSMMRDLSPKPAVPDAHTGGCPGSMMREFQKDTPATGPEIEQPSQLGHWPVQLMLVSPMSPFLQGADVLLTADCVPFAFAGFHQTFLTDKSLLIGCPKLDDLSYYTEKLTDIFSQADIKSLTVIHMEVPCCTGLLRAAETALKASGKNIPFRDVVIGIQGDIVYDQEIS